MSRQPKQPDIDPTLDELYAELRELCGNDDIVDRLRDLQESLDALKDNDPRKQKINLDEANRLLAHFESLRTKTN